MKVLSLVSMGVAAATALFCFVAAAISLPLIPGLPIVAAIFVVSIVMALVSARLA